MKRNMVAKSRAVKRALGSEVYRQGTFRQTLKGASRRRATSVIPYRGGRKYERIKRCGGRSRRHAQRGQHFGAGVGAFEAGGGGDAAVFVPFGMARTFGGAGAAKSDAGGELRFQRLPVAGFIGARDHASGRGADGGAIEVEPNAGNQRLDMALGETSVRAGGAGLAAQ